jgi:hypothetical protein
MSVSERTKHGYRRKVRAVDANNGKVQGVPIVVEAAALYCHVCFQSLAN